MNAIYKPNPPISFTGSGLDRADHIRADADKLAELTNWRARLLRLDGLDPVIADDGGLAGARWPMLMRRTSWCSSGSIRRSVPALPPFRQR